MKLDKLGRPYFNGIDLMELIYSGQIDKLKDIRCEDCIDVREFNISAQKMYYPQLALREDDSIDQSLFDQQNQATWFMPDEWKIINVTEWLTSKCQTVEQYNRVIEELKEFEKRNLFNLLRFLMYLVSHLRENKVVWGVGRGSSVASYVLYLIGIHKIDPLKFNLDWHEFLR